MAASNAADEFAILSRLLQANTANLPAAKVLLAMDFEPKDRDRMRELSAKAQAGTLSPEERPEIDGYERVGHLLDLLHSRARRSLSLNSGSTY